MRQFNKKVFLKKSLGFQVFLITYSLTRRNLSPSLATHRPRELIAEPLNVISCCSPDWNHDPFHCEGKTQFVDAENIQRKGKNFNINFCLSRIAKTFVFILQKSRNFQLSHVIKLFTFPSSFPHQLDFLRKS